MRCNSKMSEKIFNLWQSTTTNKPAETTTSTTMSQSSSTSSTIAPTTRIETELNILIKSAKENNNELIGTIETVISEIEALLVLIVILIGVIVLYKIIKLCRKGYNHHNEKVIKRHETANTRV